MRFLRALGWEFIQNLPLVAGFLIALDLWQGEQYSTAVFTALLGSTLGALLIRWTEARIVEGHQEPLAVTLGNIGLMTTIMTALILYLGAGWSGWLSDLIVGVALALLLGLAQDLAAGEKPSWRHIGAFALAFPVTLIALRLLAAQLPLGGSILLLTTIITLLIAGIDYGSVPPEPEENEQ